MPKVSVTCGECGKVVLRVPSQAGKFCCSSCAHAYRRRALATQNRADITCGACGKTWNAPKSVADSGRKWCSKACQYSFPGVCAGCNEPFNGKLGQLTCGQRCRNAIAAAKRAHAKAGRTCAYCHGPIDDRLKSDARYCGRLCKDEDRKAQGRIERWSTAAIRPCADCGDPVGAIRSEFCGPCRTRRRMEMRRAGTRRSYQRHRDKRIAEGKAYREANRQYFKDWYKRKRSDPEWMERELARIQVSNRRRRALRRSARSEPYTTLEIADRDGWRCQLCGKKVPRKSAARSPRSATVDHIVPISLGGDDVKANVQLAHFSCNVAKNNRALPRGEQLRLIG